MIYTINNDLCTFCGLCAVECPSGVVTIDKNSRKALIMNKGCIECSHCGMICPADAVLADGKGLPNYPDNLKKVEAAQFEHIINSKRSVRKYRTEPLMKSDLDAIMTAGRLTATATNSQQVNAVLIEGDKVKTLSIMISSVLLKAVRFGLTPPGNLLLKIFNLKKYSDRNLLKDYCKRIIDTIEGRGDVFFFNAPAVVILTYPSKGRRFGRTDCALAGQNMMLTAHNRGIASCMIGFAEAALMTKRLRKKAGVTVDRRIGLIFTLGYQAPVYYRYPIRTKWKY